MTQQDFAIAKKQEEKRYLFLNPIVWEKIYDMGKNWMSDSEILYEVYNSWEYWELLQFSPESINLYLKERGLTTQVRRAIKFTPVVRDSQKGIQAIATTSEDDSVRLKALTWLADRFDYENKEEKAEKGNVTNNVFQMSGVTQIVIEW